MEGMSESYRRKRRTGKNKNEVRRYWFALQIERDIAGRLRTADQQVSLCRRVERVRLVTHIARNQTAFAHMADSRAARPAHRHITGLRKIEQARKLRVPICVEPTARKRNARTRTC